VWTIHRQSKNNAEGLDMGNLDIEKLERLCALIEVVNDEITYRYLLDILKITVELYAREKGAHVEVNT
jgi:hypothetical protein